MEGITVLYIDDEMNNLVSFKAAFRSDYLIFLANSTSEADEILINNPQIQIVISDQRMPDITGVEFLESVKEKYPNMIRILLTGYSDIDVVINAINKGMIFRYLEKPWNSVEMKMSIDNAFQFYFLNHQLRLKNIELRKNVEELNRFAYSASHDLKAPVKSMLGLMNLMKTEGFTDQIAIHLDRSVKKLDYFIDNIIDYYKNSQKQRDQQTIEFSVIINQALELIIENYAVSDITFNVSIDQECEFVNDEFRVYVIISYLLSNAIKYQKNDSLEKTINIEIITSLKSVSIKISDKGIGIANNHINHIFDMFYRGTSQSTGSGIGLYIVKEAVEKLNGTIRVDSKEGEGSTFSVKIPNELNDDTFLL